MKKNRFISFLLVCILAFQCAGLSVTAFADDTTSGNTAVESSDDYAQRANEIGTRVGTHIADFFNRIANQAETGLDTQDNSSTETASDEEGYNDRYTRVGNRIWNFFQRITSGITAQDSVANSIAGVSTESVDDSEQSDSGTVVFSSASGTQTASVAAANAEATATPTAAVDPCVVTFTVEDSTYTYDGMPHTINCSYTLSDSTNYRVSKIITSGYQTDVGTTRNIYITGYTIEKLQEDGTWQATSDYSDNLSRRSPKADVTVTAASIELTISDVTCEYDGQPHTIQVDTKAPDGLTVSSITTSASPVDVGSTSGITVTGYNVTDAAGTTVDSKNYDVTYANDKTSGTVTITEASVYATVTAQGQWTYDGQVHSIDTVTVEGLPDGYTCPVHTCSALYQDVDDAGKTLTASDFNIQILNKDGKDVTTADYVHIQYVSGVVINPISLIIHTGSASQVYDDTTLQYTDDAHVYGALSGEIVGINVTGEQRYAGSSENSAVPVFSDDDSSVSNAKKCNYDWTEDFGTLTVTPNTTQITVTTVGKLPLNGYDGETHGAEVVITGLPSGFSATGISNATAKDVTETPVAASCNSLTITGPNGGVTSYTDEKLSSSYENFSNVEFIDTTLTINRANLIIKSASEDKTYDGSPLTNTTYTVTGLADSDKIDTAPQITGSRTEVGSSPNTMTGTENVKVVRISDNTDTTNNYTITFKEGTLKVKAASGSSSSGSSSGSSSSSSSGGGSSTTGGTAKSGTSTSKQTGSNGATIVTETVTGRGTDTTQPQTTLKSGVGPIAAPASGVIEDITAQVDNAYDAAVTPTTNLATAYGISEEDAKAGAWVWMELKHVDESLADPADKALIDDVLGDRTLAFYFSVEQYKQIYGKNAEKLAQTGEELEISFTVPEQYRSDNREFGIIRTHDGEKAELLESASYDNSTGKISFKSDKFSLYALTYVDVEPVAATAAVEATTVTEETVITAQHNLTPLYIAIAAVCGAAAGVLLTRIPKKKTK